MSTRAYEYRHVVGFEETNLVGNVYYVHFLAWQGRCRELFLRDHAAEVLADLGDGLVLATTRCTCDYFRELRAFDEVLVRMRLSGIVQNRVTMEFEYSRIADGGEELVARGEQVVACMRRVGARTVPTPVPEAMLAALRAFDGNAERS